MKTPPDQSEHLINIETLWRGAEQAASSQAEITFQRISGLMQDAIATEFAASEITENNTASPPSDTEVINRLSTLVENAARTPSEAADHPPSFDEIRTGMDNVSRMRPPHRDDLNAASPEHAVGIAFSDMVRHVVRDYINNEVEGVIKHAIKSELETHFREVSARDTNQAPKKIMPRSN